MNFFRGKLTETDFVIDNAAKIKVTEGKMKILREQGYVNKDIVLGIRPEDIHDELLFLEASRSTAFTTKIEVAELLRC